MGLSPASRDHAREYADQMGVSPTHTEDARARRQAANSAQRALQREWEVTHRGEVFDPEWFREHVLPGLATLSLPAIAKATGMSATAAGKVRSGERVPHPRHWEGLEAIGVQP